MLYILTLIHLIADDLQFSHEAQISIPQHHNLTSSFTDINICWNARDDFYFAPLMLAVRNTGDAFCSSEALIVFNSSSIFLRSCWHSSACSDFIHNHHQMKRRAQRRHIEWLMRSIECFFSETNSKKAEALSGNETIEYPSINGFIHPRVNQSTTENDMELNCNRQTPWDRPHFVGQTWRREVCSRPLRMMKELSKKGCKFKLNLIHQQLCL